MKKITSLLLFSAILFAISCKKNKTTPQPEPIPERAKFVNIPYATAHNAQQLDIYLPAALPPYPVAVMIHGGGWVIGDKQEYNTSIKTEALLTRGYAVVAINYRLSGVAKFPAQIRDVKAAIRFIKANATTYKFNPNKIGAWGTSAGGHLTALLATSGGINTLEDLTMGNATQNSKIQAAVDWFGPTNFLQMDAQSIIQGCGAGGHDLVNSPESQLMGYAIQTQSALVAFANPITYITSDDPPIYIAHGNNDCTVPRNQSLIFYNALTPLLGTTNIKLNNLTASGHGTGQFENAATVNLMIDFLDIYLK
jgi:acetyl esterase/lipase